MKNYITGSLILLTLLFSYSCEKDQYDMGELIAPSNLEISYTIVGADESNPFGDGTGVVDFVATADNAITYNFDFGDGLDHEMAGGGVISHRYSDNGTFVYNITVLAVGTGGITTSKSFQIEVYSSFSDLEAIEFLTGNSEKKWYWAADQLGHAGLGPNYEDAGMTWASWWNAAAWEKDCMYDAELVFRLGESGVTFEQTAGPAFIPGTYAGVIGVDADQCYGDDVVTNLYGEKAVSFMPANSIATVAGGYRGTAFKISENGCMCWWVGSSTYEIIEITENILKVRVEEDATYAWYHTFTTVKPEQ